ncbi:hypothetical protein FQR65_LT14514 [Abscondita terminalis]|nr:hypothetical protein FQR65_LT14514 [Abscondita terminalis]
MSLFSFVLKSSLTRVTQRTIKRWVAPTLRELEKRRRMAGPQPLQKRSSYLEWNYEAELYALGKRIGEEFQPDILQRALVHKSYIIQQEISGNQIGNHIDNGNSLALVSDSFSNFEDNTDLIKEGESLIVDCITKKFSSVYPAMVVKAICVYLTSNTMLAHVAAYMGVKDIILSADYPVEEVTCADTFKAIVAALNRSNVNRTEAFINDFLISQMHEKDVFDIWDVKHPYDVLLQLAEEKGLEDVEPRLCNQSASNTILANYQVGLYSNKKLLGIGWGESIDIAKDTAALDAIRKLYSLEV